MLFKMSAYVKRYDSQTKWMYFLIEDDDLLKKKSIWGKVSADIRKKKKKNENQNKILQR